VTVTRRACLAVTTTLGVAAVACHYAGPLAGGGSSIREGALPDRAARFLAEAGGARSIHQLLPTTAADSAAIYLLVVDHRALGVPGAKVAVLPRSTTMPDYPKTGWEPVDSHGVFARRLAPGEYVVFVQDEFHWSARRLVRLGAGRVDTLLAIMRNAADVGGRELVGSPFFR